MRAKSWRSGRCRAFLLASRSRVPSSEVPGASPDRPARPVRVAQELLPDPRAAEPDRGPVQLAELVDQPLVGVGPEPPERFVRGVGGVEPLR